MKRLLSYQLFFLFLLSFTPFLTGCTDMYDQPSFKPQEGPRLSAPEGAVPLRGIDIVLPGETPENRIAKSPESVQQGKKLFYINCALCHGSEGRGDGPVGKKYIPPPPNLHSERVQSLSESDIYMRIYEGYGRMPAFRERISFNDRWHLVNFVREFGEN